MEHSGERIQALDFIRAASMIGIFAYHAFFAFDQASPDTVSLFRIPDEAGFILVGVFFILSGVLLELHYEKLKLQDITMFYRRRAGSLLFMYYLVFLLFFSARLFIHPSSVLADFKDHGWTLLFTAAGLDGYFARTFPTWYLTGEWFIGALILLYFLYPFLNMALRHIKLFLLLAVIILYLRFLNYPLWSQSTITNIFSCMLCFVSGMVIGRYRLFKKKYVPVFAVLALVVLLIPQVYVYLGEDIHAHLASPAVFLVLYRIGDIIMRFRLSEQVFSFLSSISYPFYLVHHMLIDKAVLWTGGRLHPFLLSVLIFVFSVILSTVLQRLYGRLRQNANTKNMKYTF